MPTTAQTAGGMMGSVGRRALSVRTGSPRASPFTSPASPPTAPSAAGTRTVLGSPRTEVRGEVAMAAGGEGGVGGDEGANGAPNAAAEGAHPRTRSRSALGLLLQA